MANLQFSLVQHDTNPKQMADALRKIADIIQSTGRTHGTSSKSYAVWRVKSVDRKRAMDRSYYQRAKADPEKYQAMIAKRAEQRHKRAAARDGIRLEEYMQRLNKGRNVSD